MQLEEITPILREIFGSNAVEEPSSDSWQVDTMQMRLLVLLSQDNFWLRVFIPILPAIEAEPFLQQLLEANFDFTQEMRYAINQEILWGVFQHRFASLTIEDFKNAIATAVSLHETGLSECFNRLIEQRMREIVKAAKLQGQTLEATLQNLDRFYQEGMLGGLQQDPQEREQFLAAWRYQLPRFWSETEP
jgi:hypothetical protein